MKKIRRGIIFFFSNIGRGLRDVLMKNEDTYKLLFTPGHEEARWRAGKWKAWQVFEKARVSTPAYHQFLSHQKFDVKLKGWDPDFSSIPPMDKESYIKKFSIEARCAGGKIPSEGVMIDESSGTSGPPSNWVRGYDERKAVKIILQISVRSLLGKEPLFLINAFALGPWATGMNVSMSLVDVTILKSTGPDIAKIENTLNAFGPKYRYVITGYPPFLKLLADSKKVDWDKFDITVIFGGEGMGEEMRTYLKKSFRKIYGSYGASDLEINMAAENDFTIALRQLMIKNEQLFQRLAKSEYGLMPMIFQYNPLDYYIETNEDGELLVTLCRISNIAPKVRYNIHDLGHVWRVPELKKALEEFGINIETISSQYNELPLLFHYGRSDMSVAFYGCKITPQDIEEIVFSTPKLAKITSSFSLLVAEDKMANKKLTIAIELESGKTTEGIDEDALRIEILQKLKEVNQDYRESAHMIPKGAEPLLEFFDYGQGPFALNDIRLKKRYIQKQ